MKPTYTNLEQFVVYVRTKQFMQQRLKNKDPNSHVFISMTEIRERFLSNPKLEIQSLVEQNELDVILKLTNQGNLASYYKAIKEGKYDVSLLDLQNQVFDELEVFMTQSLKLVTLLQNSTSSPYFDCFLENKDRYIFHFFTVDTFSARVHTPVTNFRKDYRSNLLLDGEETASLDVAQMQPMLLGKILQQHIGPNEYSSWINLGLDIYTILQNLAKLNSREEAKTRFFEILFSRPNKYLSKLFGNTDWIEWITNYKRIYENRNPYSKNKPHSNISWLLQTTEVQIMRRVWQLLMDNDILFLSIHDEIIIKESDLLLSKDLFAKVLSSEFESFKICVK